MLTGLNIYANTVQASQNQYFQKVIQIARQYVGRAFVNKIILIGLLFISVILFSSCNPDDDSSTDGTSGATSQNSFFGLEQVQTAHHQANSLFSV
jgi:hypothetical protein